MRCKRWVRWKQVWVWRQYSGERAGQFHWDWKLGLLLTEKQGGGAHCLCAFEAIMQECCLMLLYVWSAPLTVYSHVEPALLTIPAYSHASLHVYWTVEMKQPIDGMWLVACTKSAHREKWFFTPLRLWDYCGLSGDFQTVHHDPQRMYLPYDSVCRETHTHRFTHTETYNMF